MRLPDINLLVYAYDDRSPRNAAAVEWLEGLLASSETVAFAWVVLLGFVRFTTNPAVFEQPFSSDASLDMVEAWLAQPSATVVQPTPRHARVLRDLLSPLGAAGNLTSDAHLAALAIEHGATLCSGDNDFARFAGLSWEDPLR